MKDLKKCLHMHYISSKTRLYMITMFFAIMAFFTLINTNFSFKVAEGLLLILYHASLFFTIIAIKPVNADRNLLVSLPMKNFEVYPWSVLLFKFMVLGFYLILFIPSYLLSGALPGPFY